MGLDIYLYRYDNFRDTREREELYQDYSNKLWEDVGEFDSLSEEQKNELREKDKEFAKSLGLDEWGTDKINCEKIEMDHPDYPEHYFKIGYFRSSYNSGGIQRILKNLGVDGLDYIFLTNDSSYHVKPDWDNALIRCEGVLNQFKEKGAYRVNVVSGNIFRESNIKSEKDALSVFLEELSKNPEGGYSNANGDFYQGEPIKVLAMIPGKTKIFNERDCVYVITESDNSWYVQALEIVRDTIKYVLSQENKDQYYLHWSG